MPAKPVSRRTTPQAKARTEYHKVPTKTPAEDPGRYSKTPHDYGDVLIAPDAKGRTRLGGALQRDLVYWIERNTWGKNTGTPVKVIRPEWAKLSLTQLARLCGSDRRTVARNLADLVARGIIEARDRTGCGATVAKMYKLTPERWRKAPYYEPKVMDLEDVPEDQEEDDAEVPELVATDEPERTVDPGKVSKPQAVAVSPSRGAPVVAIRLVYRSVDLPFPVAFKAAPGRNGRVQISCRATAPQRFAIHSPSETVVTVEDNQLTSYSAFITPFVLSVWGKAADETLLNQIVEAANGAPVAVYERVVRARFEGSRKRHTTGLLIELAKDAKHAHDAERSEAWRKSAAEARRRAQDSPGVVTPAEDMAEPQADPWPCQPCNGTGNAGTWDKGKFTPRTKPYVTCPKCKGTGKEKAAAR